ncbi:chemotaxis protein CheW [Virgibacillus sp. MSP4-1]|uniref:chemotaxis protein CheW n=1 Tax=Virgibacillus sp. MSP4-1 TaxID=2700081 RepID=UPI0005C51B12|nr:chemotaxis protein CheW [Virgibacillus sp. MSP4-1]QHS23448.1 chemotaxis protein CheW [Virgibacillus sp. MSP4-1]
MEETSKVLVFQLNKELYGIHIQQVLAIEKLTTVTAVPNTSRFIKGVINLRGEITPLIDLKDRLGIGQMDESDSTRVLVVTIQNTQVGLIVDAATDVKDIDESMIDSPPNVMEGVSANYIIGVARFEEQLLILLDLEKVLNLKEIDAAEAVNEA